MSVNPVMGEEKMNEMVTEFWPVKPEPGSVADQLLQKGRAQGEEIGEARGEVRGHAHTVRILQSVLGIPQTSDEELLGKNIEELQATIESLQQQVVQRLN